MADDNDELPPVNQPQRMRGAIPTPRHRLAAATPHRIIGETPSQWIIVPQKLSMWYNDRYGDCVTAEEAFAKACSGILISDAEVKRWAQAHGVLNGAMLDQVVDWMIAKGFGQDGNQYNDGSRVAVDYTNAASLQNAISRGPVKIGVAAGQLENSVGSRNGWFATGYRHDQRIDHCVALCGYGPMSWLAQQLGVAVPSRVDGNNLGYALFTWSTIGIIDEASMLAITGEAWLRVPTNITVGSNPPTPDPVYTPTIPTPTPVPPSPGPTPVPGLDWTKVATDTLALEGSVRSKNATSAVANAKKVLADLGA